MLQDHTTLVTWTSPASATTEINATEFRGLLKYDWFTVDAKLTGGTGGSLDIYLQRLVYFTSAGVETWADWIHFPQKAAAAAATYYTVTPQSNASIVAVGTGAAASATPALAVNTTVGGHPGQRLRIVSVANSGTSAGASQTIWLRCWRNR